MPDPRRTVIAVFAAVALAAGATACGSDDKKATPAATVTEGDGTSVAQPRSKPKVTVPKGPAPKKLVIKDLIKGTGATAKAGDPLTMNYVGVLYSTGKQFDASYDRGQPFPFQLGAGQVITGWDKGIVGMRVGGRRELIIPPGEGYGSEGSPPTIPPNATLVFVVDLLSIG
jgi:FKBP-type peptidyl-prolyl cis-trans isomerase